MAVAESWGRREKSVMTGSRTRDIPLQNMEFVAVHFQGPVRILPLPSYCEKTTRLFATPCSPEKRPCLNSVTVSTQGRTGVLYYPTMLSHFLHSLRNYTLRAIFPEMCKINQSSVDCHCKPFGWLIDWRQVNFDLIGLLESYRPICFYGGRG